MDESPLLHITLFVRSFEHVDIFCNDVEKLKPKPKAEICLFILESTIWLQYVITISRILRNFSNYNLLINNFDNYSSNLIICDD